MPLFALHCLDRPDAATPRATARPAHLAYVRAQAAEYRFGAHLLDAAGAAP